MQQDLAVFILVRYQACKKTIGSGVQNFSFSVTVFGDLNIEPDEGFFVEVTNVSGATVSDAQGVVAEASVTVDVLTPPAAAAAVEPAQM